MPTLNCECYDVVEGVYGVYLARLTVDDDSAMLEVRTGHRRLFEKGKKYRVTVEAVAEETKRPAP